jgi:hypothetical protein
MLSIFLSTDPNDAAFLITRPYSSKVFLDETVIGLYTSIAISYEFLEIVPLPIEHYNDEINKHMSNKL